MIRSMGRQGGTGGLQLSPHPSTGTGAKDGPGRWVGLSTAASISGGGELGWVEELAAGGRAGGRVRAWR